MTPDLLFKDLVELLNEEDLIRFCRRAEKRGMPVMAELLTVERKAREKERKEARKKEKG